MRLGHLATAGSVEAGGWAQFDYVRMPDYRWGIFLEPKTKGRTDPLASTRPAGLAGGARRAPHHAAAAHRHPGGHRARERRAAAPCSADSCPCVYDLRNLFQVNVEEGRHLWAMVYLLHSLLRARRPRGGRGAARSAAAATPTSRACSAPSTSRAPTGSRSSCSRSSPIATASSSSWRCAESAFDPLSRTTRFMLTEEAHHMFVGETGVLRIVDRTAKLMAEAGKENRTPRPGPRARRHRSADDAEVPEPLVHALARPVRSESSTNEARSNHRGNQRPLRGNQIDDDLRIDQDLDLEVEKRLMA